MLADVPEAPVSASSWRLCEGFHWRLNLHQRTRHTAGLTIAIVRETNFLDVTIGLHLRHLSDHMRKPVRNLSLMTKERLPHERHVDVRLPAGVASKTIKLSPIAVPMDRFTVELSLDVRQCMMDTTRRPSVRDSHAHGITNGVERFIDSYSEERSIAWLGETEPTPERDGMNGEILLDAGTVTNERDDASAPFTVPYSLITLFKQCNSEGEDQSRALTTSFSDVTMVVGSGFNKANFNLHRCVLALASPVFRAMLGSDMLERRTGKVELPNFTPQAVALALRHIYGSKVDLVEHAFELYQFAHQFDIVSLSEEARNAIIQNIELRNCASLLRFGMAFQDEEILSVSRKLIAMQLTDITQDDIAGKELIRIPRAQFLQLLEGDTIRATEAEILLLALRWLVVNKNEDISNVLRRIRWDLIAADFHDPLERACLSVFGTTLKVIAEDNEDQEAKESRFRPDYRSRPRWIGKPHASVQVPIVTAPPALFLSSFGRSKQDRKGTTRKRVRGSHSRPIETSFDHGNLRWTLRANLNECRNPLYGGSRLSASLWLEQGDDGEVWTENGGKPLPVHVFANFIVTNCLGGQLHVAPIDVVFRSAGWGNGWCVQDLFDGAKTRLSDYGDVVQVSVEIHDMRPAETVVKCTVR